VPLLLADCSDIVNLSAAGALEATKHRLLFI